MRELIIKRFSIIVVTDKATPICVKYIPFGRSEKGCHAEALEA